MKRRGVFVVITLLFTVIILSAFVQCDHDGMARVTIHIQNDSYTENSKSFIDKLLNIFSTKVYAQPVPWWSGAHGAGDGTLTLYTTGINTSTIETNIPPESSSYTITLPSGNDTTLKLLFE